MYALIITLVISACQMPSSEKISSKMAELQKENPAAQVKLKVDQSCMKAAKFNGKL